jgi:UDP-N-acetylmuramate--alanine ligase
MISIDALCLDRSSPAMDDPPSRRAHLVGIAGAGMRSLADLLDEAGWQVSGSDESLAAGSIPFEVKQGHDAEYVDVSIDLVVHSDAVDQNNPELRRARQLGIRSLSYPRMLGELMRSRRGVAVAGTHGKSTTTAMAGGILAAAGLDPALVVGAAPIGARSGGRFGQGEWMLVEACEYRANFHHLCPQLAAILNIEPDHFDCFHTQHELEEAFARFAAQVPEDGLVLARHDCPATQRAIAGAQARLETFGLSPEATWHAEGLSQRLGYYCFELYHQDRYVSRIKLPVPGKHNVLNAVAAAALASHCGADEAAIREGLEGYVGLRRRLQLLGTVRNVTYVDDYAHHPTEVTAALATLREMYPHRRIVCVFQPHQASRLARLLDEFAASLHNADTVIVADVYRARENAADVPTVGVGGTLGAGELVERLSAQGAAARYMAEGGEIKEHLKHALRPGDVLVTMGAGDIGTVAHELGKGLRTYC